MSPLQSILWLACSVAVCTSASVRNRRQVVQRPFTLEETVPTQFGQVGFTGRWISDTQFTYTISGSSVIYLFDVSTLASSLFLSDEVLNLIGTTNPTLSPDGQYLLAATEVVSVFRYSTTARYALYEIATGNIFYIADHQRLELCIFDGVGHGIGYVLDNNVYYLPENSQTAVQLTFDGIPGVLYNGHADWVYEEEILGTGQAMWFSKDGNRLAVASFDDTDVETYSFYFFDDNRQDTDDLYPELYHLKYPKVGRRNPTVTLRHINLQEAVAGSLNWATLQAPELVTEDHVLGAVGWITEDEVAVHWLVRRQNVCVLRICNVTSSVCTDDIYEEPEGWVRAALPTFGSNGTFYAYLRWTETLEDGDQWRGLQVTYRGENGLTREYVAAGRFTVMSVQGIAENDNEVTFYHFRTVVDQPWRRHLWANDRCLSCSVVMPEGGECTWATATVSTGGSYLSITCQSTFEPAVVVLVEGATGNIVLTWEDNQNLRERLSEYLMPGRLTTTVPLTNGKQAPITFYLPPGFDINDNSVQYPVIYYVYSGPAYYLVQDILSIGYSAYLTTNRSVIYMMADGRGSDLNGKDHLFSINNGMGSVEIEDHLVILREVFARFPWVDRTRVGMWGSSYGGYSTLLTLINDDENLVRCGVSSAPVTSWLYYDTLYTERYMGVPTEEDNLSGYLNGDIANQAERLRGKDFYIMHGNADDNVHFQNAAALLKKLQELNIQFQQMSYPDEAHSLAGVARHRYNTMDRYWTECLNLTDREY